MTKPHFFSPLLLLSLLLWSSNGQCKAGTNSESRFGSPRPLNRQMQPLQPGQPPQKPATSISTTPAIVGGQPGNNALPFNQPFRLGEEEYQFMAAKGKDHVGLDASPAMRPRQGNAYFLVRYQVIHHGKIPLTVPNAAAIHLLNMTTNQTINIDEDATNANVQSGAATGLPDQLVLEPGRPQIQTLVFQLSGTVDPRQLAVLVTDPKDPRKVFQIVKLTN